MSPPPPQASVEGLRKGSWTPEEDAMLRKCMEKYGEVKWCRVPRMAGLNRCPKSCRLRWLNYLSPTIKRGRFDAEELDLIIRLHNLLGNRWSLIAGRLPGRTANDIKNYWNTHLSRKRHQAKGEAENSTPLLVKVLKPKTRTIPPNWRWKKDMSQEELVVVPMQSSLENHIACCMDLSPIVSDIELGGHIEEELQSMLRVEFLRQSTDGPVAIEGHNGFGWEDFHCDLKLWEDFGSMMM